VKKIKMNHIELKLFTLVSELVTIEFKFECSDLHRLRERGIDVVVIMLSILPLTCWVMYDRVGIAHWWPVTGLQMTSLSASLLISPQQCWSFFCSSPENEFDTTHRGYPQGVHLCATRARTDSSVESWGKCVDLCVDNFSSIPLLN